MSLNETLNKLKDVHKERLSKKKVDKLEENILSGRYAFLSDSTIINGKNYKGNALKLKALDKYLIFPNGHNVREVVDKYNDDRIKYTSDYCREVKKMWTQTHDQVLSISKVEQEWNRKGSYSDNVSFADHIEDVRKNINATISSEIQSMYKNMIDNNTLSEKDKNQLYTYAKNALIDNYISMLQTKNMMSYRPIVDVDRKQTDESIVKDKEDLINGLLEKVGYGQDGHKALFEVKKSFRFNTELTDEAKTVFQEHQDDLITYALSQDAINTASSHYKNSVLAKQNDFLYQKEESSVVFDKTKSNEKEAPSMERVVTRNTTNTIENDGR